MTRTTPLHDVHEALGATFTEFAGYDMPVHYGSIKDEHAAVREDAGLFDVSHMSNLWVTGPEAARTLSAVMPFDFGTLDVGRCKYSVFLRQDGTILDDTIVSRVAEDRFWVVPNAGMAQAAADHLRAHGDATVEDVTDEWAILALQGPNAPAILKDLGIAAPGPFRIEALELDGVRGLVSGTGYTGEKGGELFIPAEDAETAWDSLVEAGILHDLHPVGLGARDTLRLEKGYCLAGNEFAGGRTPVEARLEWLMDWKHEFLGKDALLEQKAAAHPLLWGLLQEKGVPRHGYEVLRDGAAIGEVTSGTQSPTLGKGIALAYLQGAAEGDTVQVQVRARAMDAQVVRPPFV